MVKIIMLILPIFMVIGVNAQQFEVEGKTIITEMDTITNASGSVVRLTDGTLAIRQYKIGDFAHGGIIFWVDETGQHGLVVDTSDISTGTTWGSDIFRGALGGEVVSPSIGGIRAGIMNTMLIVAGDPYDASAGKLCADLKRAGYGDWYLPSMGELNLMYLSRAAINASAITIGGSRLWDVGYWGYWSSNEYDFSGAYLQSFETGLQVDTNKDTPYPHVRAIRAF